MTVTYTTAVYIYMQQQQLLTGRLETLPSNIEGKWEHEDNYYRSNAVLAYIVSTCEKLCVKESHQLTGVNKEYEKYLIRVQFIDKSLYLSIFLMSKDSFWFLVCVLYILLHIDYHVRHVDTYDGDYKVSLGILFIQIGYKHLTSYAIYFCTSSDSLPKAKRIYMYAMLVVCVCRCVNLCDPSVYKHI